MTKILLVQLDGCMPNLALMRLAAHHRALGDEVVLRRAMNASALLPRFWEERGFDRVYGSLIFERTLPLAGLLLDLFPKAVLGGTGFDVAVTLEQYGVTTEELDYSIYPDYEHSIGFTQRGCRLKCGFCVVPRKEGAVRAERNVWDIWRGQYYDAASGSYKVAPRNLVLLDNDFFGQDDWRKRIEEIRYGNFKVNFNQGINVRMITEETADAVASVKYYDRDFKRRCVYTAWDNLKDERRLMTGLETLANAGIKPGNVMVYMLIGYWPWETEEDWEYRRRKLREFGADPYPMPYVRNKQTVGFQRYVVGAYDKRFTWEEFKANGYDVRGMRERAAARDAQPELFAEVAAW